MQTFRMKFKILSITTLLFVFFITCRSNNPIEESNNFEKFDISTSQKVVPVLKERENNPVLRIKLDAETNIEVKAFQISTKGTTNLDDIDKVQLYFTEKDSVFNANAQLDETENIHRNVDLKVNRKLSKGTNYFWISYKVNNQANLLHEVDASLERIIISDDTGDVLIEETDKTGSLKLGSILREGGEEGVHTYRIPGLATSNDGTLLAVYDIRYDNSSDLQGDIDVGLSRSTDKGETWEPMQIIMDMKEWGGLPEEQNGVGDPTILVDRETGTIWVAALWAHGHDGERILNATGPGFEPEETGQLLLVKSEDDGKTWSKPINITQQIKKEEWHILFNGPGKGISMRDGTLVFPAQFWDSNGMPFSTIFYSKDKGETWKVGTGAKPNTTEAQVVELSDGSLMLNMRDNRGGSRSVYTTDNLGRTWVEHPTSRSALKEPVCMASLIHFPYLETKTGKNCLLFSNPNHTQIRKDMTIKVSRDDGMTWPEKNELLLNESTGYGYSCMTPIDEKTVGILYEGIGDLYFQKIELKELISK